MSEAKTTHSEAKSEAAETAHVERKANPDVKKHVDAITASSLKEWHKIMGEKVMPTEGQLAKMKLAAAELAHAQHEEEHHLPLAPESTEARVRYEQAVEQRAHAQEKLHKVIHNEWSFSKPDFSRAVQAMKDHPGVTAGATGLAGFGIYQLATSQVPAWITSAINWLSSTSWGPVVGNGGILAAGAVAGGIVGRWLGGIIGKKWLGSEKNGKAAGTVIGAGGTAFGLSFIPGMAGGPLALAGVGGLYLLYKGIQRYNRRRAKMHLHLTPDMETIGKEQKRVTEAEIFVFDLADPTKEGFSGEVQDLFDRLKAIKSDDENKNLEAALKDEETLIENVRKLKEVEKGTEATAAREKIERARRELERHIDAAEKFAKKKEDKDPTARAKTLAKAQSLETELNLLDPTIQAIDAAIPQKKSVDAAVAKAKAAIEAAKKVNEDIPPLTPDGEPTKLKAEDAEKLAAEAEQAMEKVRNAIDKVNEAEHQQKLEQKKFENEKELKTTALDPQKKRALDIKERDLERRREALQARNANRELRRGERNEDRHRLAALELRNTLEAYPPEILRDTAELDNALSGLQTLRTRQKNLEANTAPTRDDDLRAFWASHRGDYTAYRRQLNGFTGSLAGAPWAPEVRNAVNEIQSAFAADPDSPDFRPDALDTSLVTARRKVAEGFNRHTAHVSSVALHYANTIDDREARRAAQGKALELRDIQHVRDWDVLRGSLGGFV